MTNPRILLLGGHGKVSLLMTPKILARSWDLTSVIRDPSQKDEILEAGKKGPGKVDVLVASLEDVKSEGDAREILERVKPQWVVWSAGAGGRGGAPRTNAIDRDACSFFIRAAVALPSITKFLLVSALNVRRSRAAWMDDESWTHIQNVNEEIMPTYYKAKLAADETLTVLGEQKNGFGYIVLRPGNLGDGEETGRVKMGKIGHTVGQVQRADVAEVAVRLLAAEGARGWFDLLGGEKEVGEEVDRVVQDARKGVDSRDGENLEVMRENLKL